MFGESYWIISNVDQLGLDVPVFYGFAKSDLTSCPEDVGTSWMYFQPPPPSSTAEPTLQFAGTSLIATCKA